MTKRKLDPQTEWRQEVASAFLSGTISASSLQRLVHKAQLSGATGAERLARTGKSGELTANVRRDFTRYLQRGSLWPKPYYAEIPLWDPKKEVTLLSVFCVLLHNTYVLRSLINVFWF